MEIEKLNTFKSKEELELEYTKEILIKRDMAKREAEAMTEQDMRMIYENPNKKRIKKGLLNIDQKVQSVKFGGLANGKLLDKDKKVLLKDTGEVIYLNTLPKEIRDKICYLQFTYKNKIITYKIQ